MDLGQLLEAAIGLVDGAFWTVAISGIVAGLLLCWTLDVMADKEDEPRWMAWVPVCNLYLGFRLAGLGTGAFMLVLFASLALLGGAILLAGSLDDWLLTGAAGAWSLAIWFLCFLICVRIAQRRDVSAFFGVLAAATPLAGLLVMFPAFWPAALVPLVAWLYIAFHDGLPYHFPHPVVVPVAAAIAFLTLAPLELLTSWVAAVGQEIHGELDAELDLGAMTAELDRMLLEQAKQGLEPPPLRPTGSDGGPQHSTSARGRQPPASASSEPEPELDASERLVTDDKACPTGSVAAGARHPAGQEIWCERSDVRHGPYVAWYESGQVKTRGYFREGLESYIWIGFWENGARKVEAQFKNGLQHGRMTQFDDAGFKVSESEWRNGEPYAP